MMTWQFEVLSNIELIMTSPSHVIIVMNVIGGLSPYTVTYFIITKLEITAVAGI